MLRSGAASPRAAAAASAASSNSSVNCWMRGRSFSMALAVKLGWTSLRSRVCSGGSTFNRFFRSGWKLPDCACICSSCSGVMIDATSTVIARSRSARVPSS